MTNWAMEDGSLIQTVGAILAASRGAIAPTSGTVGLKSHWTEIGKTDKDASGFRLTLGCADDLFGTRFLVDIAIGVPDTVFHDRFEHGTAGDDLAGTTPDLVGSSWVSRFNDSTTTIDLVGSGNDLNGFNRYVSPVATSGNTGIILEMTPAPTNADIDIIMNTRTTDASNDDGVHLIYRYNDNSNFFVVSITKHATALIELWKVVSGVRTSLGKSSTGEFAIDGDSVTVSVRGNDHEVFLGGTSIITATDSALSTDKRVCIGWGQIHSSFASWDVTPTNDTNSVQVMENSALDSFKIIVPNIYFSNTVTESQHSASYYFPISLPAGTTLFIRSAPSFEAVQDSLIAQILTQGESFTVDPGATRILSYGEVEATAEGTTLDAGATINTKGSYVQLVASTDEPIRWLYFQLGHASFTPQLASYLLDIAIGAAASEKIIVPDWALQCDESSEQLFNSDIGPIPVDIPAGTRISARIQCNINDATDRTLNMVIQGAN